MTLSHLRIFQCSGFLGTIFFLKVLFQMNYCMNRTLKMVKKTKSPNRLHIIFSTPFGVRVKRGDNGNVVQQRPEYNVIQICSYGCGNKVLINGSNKNVYPNCIKIRLLLLIILSLEHIALACESHS